MTVNLLLDGVTNAEQDRINARFKAPGSYMMLAINFWILTFHAVYLGAGWAVFGPESELAKALYFMATFPEVCVDRIMTAMPDQCTIAKGTCSWRAHGGGTASNLE